MYRHSITCFALITFLWNPSLVWSNDSSDDEAQHTQHFKTIKGLPSADDIAGNSNFDPRTIDKKLKEISHDPGSLIYPLDYVQVLAMLEAYHIGPVGYIQQLACLNQTHRIPQALLVAGKPSDLKASARVLQGFGAQLVRQGETNSLDPQECSSFTHAVYNHISFLCASSLMGVWTFPTFDTQRDLNGLPTHCFAGSLTTFYMHAGTQHYFMLPFESFKLLVKYDTQSGDEAISKLEIEALLRSKPSSISFDMPCVNLKYENRNSFLLSSDGKVIPCASLQHETKTDTELSASPTDETMPYSGPESINKSLLPSSGTLVSLTQSAKLKLSRNGFNVESSSPTRGLHAAQETHITINGPFHISIMQFINGYPIELLALLIKPENFEKLQAKTK